MTAKEELAALKKKVEELEAKLSPPKPFVPPPYERYDPTAGMCMPPSRCGQWSLPSRGTSCVTLCATTVRRAHDPPFATQWRRRRQCPRLRHWVGTRNAYRPTSWFALRRCVA